MNKNMNWYVQKGEHVLKIRDNIYDGYKTYKDLRLSGALIFAMLNVLYLRHSPHAHIQTIIVSVVHGAYHIINLHLIKPSLSAN